MPTDTMLCLVFRDGRLDREETRIPVLEQADWAMLEVTVCGVCGSDIHHICGHEPLGRKSAILGHEVVGVVWKAPTPCGPFSEGVKVACIPFFTCGTCPECRAGLPGNCANKRGLGLDLTGGFAPFVAMPAKCLALLPPGGAPVILYSLADALAVVINALARLDRVLVYWRDCSVLVVGDGTMGLLTVWLARQRRAQQITLVAKNASNGRLGLALGASTCVEADKATELRNQFPVVVEAVGGCRPEPYDVAFKAVTPGGVVMLLGVPSARFEEQCNLRTLTYKEPLLTSTNSYCRHHFVDAVDLISHFHEELGSLVTHRLSLTEAAAGSLGELLAKRASNGAVKIVIDPREPE